VTLVQYVCIIDDRLTLGPELSTKLVGRAQGRFLFLCVTTEDRSINGYKICIGSRKVGVDKLSAYQPLTEPNRHRPPNFSLVVGIKFCSESRFGNRTEPNRIYFRPINQTDIKRNDVILVKMKRLIFVFSPFKKSKRRRFITYVNRFNRPLINRLIDLTDRLLTDLSA
jgi:hypothetical protein